MRRAFTLVEVMVALTITALVATMAWVSLGAGVDTGTRLRDAREGVEAEAAVRAMLGDALRHALPGSRGGEAVFVLERGAAAGTDRLRFTSRGIVPPLGGSAAWWVSVEAGRAGLVVEARPVDADGLPIRATLAHVRGLSVLAAARSDAGWREEWPSADQAPSRVALRLTDAAGRGVGAPVVSRIGWGTAR